MTIKKNNLYKSFKYKKIKITLYIKFIFIINNYSYKNIMIKLNHNLN